jgi:hypothetical protein
LRRNHNLDEIIAASRFDSAESAPRELREIHSHTACNRYCA